MNAALKVCGDCKSEIVEAGGEIVPCAVISLGSPCEAHATHFAPQATSEVRPAEGWRKKEPPPNDPDPEGLPPAIGPWTEVATRLLSAWTTGQEGAIATGELEIDRAVDVARKLLARTKGR